MRRGIYTDFETGKRYLLIDRGALGFVACELSDGIQTGTPGTTPAKGGEKRNGKKP